jgi:hypothetical protein
MSTIKPMRLMSTRSSTKKIWARFNFGSFSFYFKIREIYKPFSERKIKLNLYPPLLLFEEVKGEHVCQEVQD